MSELQEAYERGYSRGLSFRADETYDDGFKDGESQAIERIIKLLDDWRCGHPDCDGDKTEVCYPKHYLIERIKGETNG